MARTQGKGWFRTRKQSGGEFLLYCWSFTDPGTGKKAEKTQKLGLVSDFPDEASRWAEVGRLGLSSKLIDKPTGSVTFAELVQHYIDSGAISEKNIASRKANATVYTLRHNLERFCLPRWKDRVVSDIRPREVKEWLKYLHERGGLAWTTVSKVAQSMKGVLKYGRTEGLLPGNVDPFRDIRCDASTDYEAITCSPEQTLCILSGLPEPLFTLTLVIAATGLSISEALGLRWSDVEHDKNSIVVRRSWVEELSGCKNSYRKAPVPMHPTLGQFLKEWHRETMYGAPSDWVFASPKTKGEKPLCGSTASQRYLYPAAVKAGVLKAVHERNAEGRVVRTRYFDANDNPVRRFGWHNLRHSLASWLVSNGVDVKTVSSMLRHSNIKTTLELYSHAVDANKLSAQEQYLNKLLTPAAVQ